MEWSSLKSRHCCHSPTVMTHWKDCLHLLGIGRSGFQYQQSLPCALPQDAAAGIVTEFFRSHGAEPGAGTDRQTLTFTRGCKWNRRWLWLQPCSEQYPDQRITVTFTPQAPAVDLSYDIRARFCRSCTPKALVQEARELAGLLQPL